MNETTQLGHEAWNDQNQSGLIQNQVMQIAWIAQ